MQTQDLAKTEVTLPMQHRLLDLKPQKFAKTSFNDEARSMTAVVATESMALRWNPEVGQYMELLILDDSVDVSRVEERAAPLLWQHHEYIGITDKAWIENRELHATLQFSKSWDLAQRIYGDMKENLINKFSIGYTVGILEDANKRDEKNGIPIFYARKVKLFEVTVTPMPQDTATGVRETENIYPCEIHKVQERSMPPEVVPEVTLTQTNQPNFEQLLAQRETETEQRIAHMYQQQRKHKLPDEFVADLLKRKVSIEKSFELILDQLEKRQEQETPIPVHTRVEVVTDHRDKMIGQAVEILMSRNVPQSNIKISQGNQFANHTLMDIGKVMLEDTGVNVRGLSQAIMYQRLQGMEAFKTLQANYASRTLQAGYDSVVRSWEPFIIRKPVRNFAEVLVARASRAPKPRKIVNGIVQQGSLAADEIEKTKLTSYSTWIALDRQAILSDDLGQFTEEIWAFGTMSGLLESQLIYSQLINNAVMSDGKPFFSADHGNVGAGETLDIEGLSTARQAIRSQRSSTGEPIQLSVSCIITGTALETKAEQVLFAGTTPAAIEQVNPFRGKYSIISDSLFDENSDIWIASVNKDRHPIGMLGYLEGQDKPYVLDDTDITVDGTRFRYGIDVVAKLLDWRGAWINKLPTKKMIDPSEEVFPEEAATAIRERRPSR